MRNSLKKRISEVSVVFVVLICSSESFASRLDYSSRPRRPGRILYQVKKGINGTQMKALSRVLTRLGGVRQRVNSYAASADLVPQNVGIQQSEEDFVNEFLATGAVEYAEPDYLMDHAASVNDPKVPSQWHHQVMRSYDAWDVTMGRPQVIVAVCDSGVDATHPDLKSNLILPGYNTVDGSTRTSPVTSHGTSVAGLIAAQANNSIGIAGVASRVKILPIRVSNNNRGSAYLSDLAECVRYGADRGAKVVNLSYSGAESRTIDSAAQYAKAKGTLLFMAAGNEGTNISTSTPDYSSFILVASTNRDDRRSSFSNYGTPIDLAAPGGSVYTTLAGGGYGSISGTSFASPLAAAVGALVYSVNPQFTPDEVAEILYESADAVGSDVYFGHGRVNAFNAVIRAQDKSR